MSSGLVRYHHTGDVHWITFSCFRHRPILGTPQARDKFLEILEQTRLKYAFAVIGYVVMPTHVHLLLSEPEVGTISTVMQVLKQRFSRTRQESEVWEKRYYDFNIKSAEKWEEKLHYVHQNPVDATLTKTPEAWPWSSHPYYTTGELGPVLLHRPSMR